MRIAISYDISPTLGGVSLFLMMLLQTCMEAEGLIRLFFARCAIEYVHVQIHTHTSIPYTNTQARACKPLALNENVNFVCGVLSLT